MGTTIPRDVRRLFARKYGPIGVLALALARLKRDKPVLLEIRENR